MTDSVAIGARRMGRRGSTAPVSRIAIAGAGGYVGRLLANQLAGAGHRVSALGRHSGTLPTGEWISPVIVDVADPESTTHAMPGADAAYFLVLHRQDVGGLGVGSIESSSVGMSSLPDKDQM